MDVLERQDPWEEVPRVPGFRVLGELGRGAMGVVYLAYEEALGREVALKVLRSGIAPEEEQRARFAREVKAAARIRHPNIVAVHSTGEADGRLWYVMQYVEGKSLDRVLREAGGSLPAARAVRIAREVARTLHAAHRSGVVHRDVKPGNVILVTDRAPDTEETSPGRRLRESWVPGERVTGSETDARVDRPLLVDFGLAFDVQSGKVSLSGVLIGTPDYMSPEQFQGRAKDVGPASDQWALGVMLYECLTGRPPFPARDLPTLGRLVCEVPPIPPSRLDPRVDRELDTIVLKCLEKDPKDRYPDCDALAEDLGRWLRELPISARPPGLVRRLRTWARHQPALATALSIVLLGAFMALVSWSWIRLDRAARASRLAAEAEALMDQGRYDEAEERFDDWIALAPQDAEPREGLDRARALARVREADDLYDQALEQMGEVNRLAKKVENLRDRARRGRAARDGVGLGAEEARGSEPWWMREPAYRAALEAKREEEALATRRAELAEVLVRALSLADAAHENAGEPGRRTRRKISELSAAWHIDEWRRATRAGDAEGAEVHRLAAEKLAPGTYDALLAEEGTAEVLASDPPADAWIFRYVREAEAIARGGPRLLPLPFDVRRREPVSPPPAAYVQDVARRLEGEGSTPIHADIPSVTEPLEGTSLHVATMDGPMSRERYARRLRETAYPLEALPENSIGRLEEARTMHLAAGRYLLLLRAEGRADTRVPFEVLPQRAVTVVPGRLPRSGEIPPGFVRVPGGEFPVGADDPLAVDPLPPGEGTVEPFLAARFEVTFADYWEFLNDDRTLAEIARHAPQGLRFVPRVEGQAVVAASEDGRWTPPSNPERPAEHLNLFDFTGWPEIPPEEASPLDSQLRELSERQRASEAVGWGYLLWRSERSEERARRAKETGEVLPDVAVVVGPGGEREFHALLFALPTVVEWERMARGADRRVFVYGDEREWSAFKGSRSRRTNARPEPVGLFPDDESPFGVRDLTGSVAEWTADWKEVGGLFWGKGSSWASQAPEDDRIASRSAWSPITARAAVGFRVVVRKTTPVR